MWLLLITSIFFPAVDGNWSVPEPAPPSILKMPASPVMISDAKIHEQTAFYRQITDPQIRSRIAIALRQANNPNAWGPVLELLKKETAPALQADLIGTLRILAEKEPVGISDTGFFRQLLSSPSPDVRRDAAVILLCAGDGGGIADMLEKETISFCAPVVLEKMRSTSVRLTKEEVARLAASPNVSVRNSTLKYYAATEKNPDKTGLLKEAAEKALKEKDIAAAVSIASGLAANQTGSGIALLKKLTSGLPDIQVRLAAAGTPGISADRKDFLLELLKDPDPSVRMRAARSLRKAQYEAVLNALGERLLDEDRFVREAAADSLTYLTGSKLPRTAQKALKNSRGYDPLLTVIQGTGNVEYAPYAATILTYAAKEKKTKLAVKAIRILGMLKAEQQAGLILNLQNHESVDVREAVASVLYRFPGEASVSALKKLIADKEEKVAIAAVESIRLQANPVFVPDLQRELNRISQRSFDFRVYVCRALGVFPQALNLQIRQILQKIILMPCIPMPQAPPAYDDPTARATAILLLLKASQAGNAECGAMLNDVLQQLENPAAEKNPGFRDSVLDEYVRQIRGLQKGKPVMPKEISPSEPEFPANRIP